MIGGGEPTPVGRRDARDGNATRSDAMGVPAERRVLTMSGPMTSPTTRALGAGSYGC